MPRSMPFFLQLIPTTPFSLELFLFTAKVKRDKKCSDKRFSFIVCLTIVTLILIATFRPHTAALHRVFLIRCVKNRIVPRDLRVRSPIPTKGARRVAEQASFRLLRERKRLTQRTEGDVKTATELTTKKEIFSFLL